MTAPFLTDISVQMKWNDPDEDGLRKFLVTEKGFNEERVNSVIAKIKASRGKSTQGRLDGFFSSVASPPKRKVRLEDPVMSSYCRRQRKLHQRQRRANRAASQRPRKENPEE